MIITVTVNPALDKTVVVDNLLPGRLNRIKNVSVDAGGKGINVSKIINVFKGESLATGVVGDESGKELVGRLEKIGLKHDFVVAKGTTRTNTKVLDEINGITELNEPGIVITKQEQQKLTDKLVALATPNTLFVLSGSLPVGVDNDFYKRVIVDLKKKGAKIFLDADGESFSLALKAKPNYIKPNKEELTQYFQVSEDISLLEAKELCRKLVNKGIELVVLSMGAKGVMYVNQERAFYAKGLKVSASSTVGAGDSMVGALAYAMEQKMDLQEIMRLGVAASAGAVTTKGTNPPTLELVEQLKKQVTIEEI